MNTKYNAANLVDYLNSKGLVNYNEVSKFIILQKHAKTAPLYLSIMTGIGAFIASMFFIGLLALIINLNDTSVLLSLGLIFIGVVMFLQRNATEHSFLIQYSFAFMIIGKLFFMYGNYKLFQSDWSITFSLLTITCITYQFYRLSLYRFLSSFVVLLSIFFNIFDHKLSLNLFLLLQVLGASILLINNKIKSDYIPLAYAVVISICVTVLSSQIIQLKASVNPISNLLLSCGLVALFGWTAGGMEKLKQEQLILASIGAILLGLISASGILIAIGLLVLGYTKHERLLIIIGGLLMMLFLIIYYYELNISLLQKSLVLFGSGVVLLVGRFYMKYKGWDQEGTSCAQK